MGKQLHIGTAGAAILLLAACSSTASASPPQSSSTGSTTVLPVVALPGYSISVFTEPNSSESATPPFAPDSVAVDQNHVFIDYQNKTAKDCTDATSTHSTVSEYSMDGKFVHSWNVPGHSDGMRIDPSTHLIWTTSCEDGNPMFATIDPSSGTVTPYAVPSPPHGGGYDDLYFLGGKTYISASNPSLDSNGGNPFPAIDQIALDNGKMTLTPVLVGNATATDTVTKSQVQLTLTDPDSLTTNTNGDLVLIDQGDSQYITISSPGTPSEKVTRTQVGDQLDDTVWANGKGRLLVTDGVSNFTYWVDGLFSNGSIITQAPNDSGVTNFLGTVDPATGYVTPFAIGFGKATGMIWVPSA
jgi:hypothetical protein